MKKLLVVLMALMLCASMAWADTGTVTVSSENINGRDMEIFKFAFIANTTGIVPATSTTVTTCRSHTCYPYDKAGYIWKVVTDPGSTSPATDYDITITDDITGADLLGGEGADRSATVTEEVVPKIGNAYGGNPATTSFTVNWANVTTNVGDGDVYVYIVY